MVPLAVKVCVGNQRLDGDVFVGILIFWLLLCGYWHPVHGACWEQAIQGGKENNSAIVGDAGGLAGVNLVMGQ